MTDDEKNDRSQGDMDDSFEQMLEESLSAQTELEPGSKVEATVTAIGGEHVFLDVGAREDGVISREELTNEGELTVEAGDRITVYVVGRREGAIHCAKRMGAAGADSRQDKEAVLSALRDAQESQIPVEGKVSEAVKGGLKVNVMGQTAFCPVSHIEVGYTEDPSVHVGQTYSFAIMRVEEEGRNIVVSRRQLLEAEAEEQARTLWESLREGDVYDGVVRNIRSYGAFVDIGGAEGLLHVSEMSHGRVEDPNELLRVGQKVKVAVKSIDPEERRISLSMKDLLEDPWKETVRNLSPNQVLTGKVVRLAPFGAFVEIAEGVDGLLHISEIGGQRRVSHPREVLSQGDEIEVRILDIDEERRRISLAMETEEDRAERGYREKTRRETEEGGEGGLGTLGEVLGKALKDEGGSDEQ